MKRTIAILFLVCSLAQSQDDGGILQYDWSWRLRNVGVSPWQIPQFSSCVGYYTFAEETNTLGYIVDRSYVGTNVGINSGMTWDPPHYGISSCYTSTAVGGTNNIFLNDLDDWSFSSGTNQLDFSISFWLRSFNGGGAETTIKKAVEWSVQTTAVTYNNLTFNRYDFSKENFAKSATTPAFGRFEWVHFVIVCPATVAGNKVAIYIDGASNTPTAGGASYRYMTNQISALTLGGSNYGTQIFIDDFTIWKNKLLTPDEALDITTNTWQTHGWSNSLYYVNRPLWSNCSCELTFVYDTPKDTAKHVLWTANRSGSTAPAWKLDGNIGYFDPDGTTDLLRSKVSAIPSGSTNYAMSCDFRATKTNLARQVLMACNSGNTNNSISIELQLDKLVYSTFVQGFTNIVGVTTVTTNIWHHAAISCADSTGSLYYDHTLEASGPVGLATNLVQMDVFNMASSASKWSSADERNIRYYTNTLTQTDVNSL